MGHEVRCRKNKIRSVPSNRGLLDVFATEGSQITGGQTALLRESQAGLRASPGTWADPPAHLQHQQHGPGADLGINLVTALALASVLAFFLLQHWGCLEISLFSTHAWSSKCQAVVKMLSPAFQCPANKANSNPCGLSKIRAYFKIEQSCPIELVSLGRLRNSREAFL